MYIEEIGRIIVLKKEWKSTRRKRSFDMEEGSIRIDITKQALEKMYQKFEQEREEEQSIRCPFCNEKQSNDDGAFPVTVWGGNEATEFNCQYCDKTFFVKEIVDRRFEVAKELKEFD
jgi:DNA-directed RNA polymerase subunit RPC12/RpoP